MYNMNTDSQHEQEQSDFYQVEKIAGSKVKGQKKYYEIKWLGYSSDENTWEPIENLTNILYMVEEFEAGQSTNSIGKKNIKHDKKDPTFITDSSSLFNGLNSGSETNNEMDCSIKPVEGSFDKNEPEKILGVVEQISN